MQTNQPNSCLNCGYDMRGLSPSANCPECGNSQSASAQSGTTIHPADNPPGKLMNLINSNIAVKGLEPVPDIRIRSKYWMRVAAMFVLALAFVQFLVAFGLIPIALYRVVLFGMSLFWPSVVIALMPANVDNSMPPMYRIIRKWIPITQWGWAVGYVVWFVFCVPTEAGTFGGILKDFMPTFVLHAIAGVGLIGLAFWLHDLALRIGLDFVARKCNLVTFSMATLGVIVFVSPWKRVAVDHSDGIPPALYWFYVVIALLPWIWTLITFARALLHFSSDSVWSLKHEENLVGRQDRINKKRDEYENKRGW